ncbi:MAG: prepilin-type N-terminal cleavage/methylation domain-containing protein [Candidatus Paceibacterota bacterium]
MNIKTKGFTLIEVVVSIGIFTVLMLAINFLFIALYRQQGADMAMLERTQQAGRLVEVMGRELREARRGENGNFTLAIAENNTLTFFSDIDNDDLAEKVSYFLNAGSLHKNVIEPGADLSYTGTGTNTVVCKEVQNGTSPIFTYYDESYTGLEGPMSSPVNVLKIKLVGISLTLNSTNRNSSYPLHIETKVGFRNLK